MVTNNIMKQIIIIISICGFGYTKHVAVKMHLKYWYICGFCLYPLFISKKAKRSRQPSKAAAFFTRLSLRQNFYSKMARVWRHRGRWPLSLLLCEKKSQCSSNSPPSVSLSLSLSLSRTHTHTHASKREGGWKGDWKEGVRPQRKCLSRGKCPLQGQVLQNFLGL